jgi:hypothetical protein
MAYFNYPLDLELSLLSTLVVTDASDGTTGAAVPGKASYVGMNVSGNLVGMTGTANGLKVDGSAVTQPTKETRSTSSSVTQVGSSATNVTLKVSNAARLGLTVHNDSTAILYLKLGATASTTSYTVQVPSQGYYEVPGLYIGIVDGIWASANGNAYVTELS